MYVCHAATRQAPRAMSEVGWCHFVCVGLCWLRWFLDEEMEKRDGLRMLWWRKMTGVMCVSNEMKWGTSQLAAREFYMHIDFSFIQELSREFEPFPPLTLSLHPSHLQFLLSSFIDLKSHSPSMTPLLSFLSNGLLCTHSYSHALSWSVWVVWCGRFRNMTLPVA